MSRFNTMPARSTLIATSRLARPMAWLAAGTILVVAACGSESTSGNQLRLDSTKWIAYTTCTDCNNADEQLWLAHPDGRGDHIIANTGDSTAHPDFSRDGKWIAYEGPLGSIDKDYEQIVVAAADGSNPHLAHIVGCAPPACGYGRASWSPDSARLALSVDFGPFQNDLPIANGIGILDLASGRIIQVTKHPNQPSSVDIGQDLYPRWSPDGSQIVFYRERAGQTGFDETAIFIVNVDGTNLHQLTLWSELAGDPDWSPDGSKIVYSTHPLRVDWGADVESELITIRPDGSGRTVLTKFGSGGPRGTQPRWTPDGKAIVYTKQSTGGDFTRHIWAIAADGSSDTPVLTARVICTNPVMEP